MSQTYVEAGDLRICYTDHGSGTPLILLHGGLATAEMMWEHRIAMLAKQYRVLAPDARGHGRTDNPAGRMSYDQMADDVMAFCAALGIERPLILGYSDGAQVAIEIGLRHPGKAKALVLGGAVSERTQSYLDGLHNWGFIEPGVVDIDKLKSSFGGFFDAIQQAHRGDGEPDYWRRILPQIATLWLTVPDYSAEQLARIGEPTLVIMGDRDDMTGEQQATRLYHALPNAELCIIPNADHAAVGKDLFWSAVMDFLGRQP